MSSRHNPAKQEKQQRLHRRIRARPLAPPSESHIRRQHLSGSGDEEDDQSAKDRLASFLGFGGPAGPTTTTASTTAVPAAIPVPTNVTGDDPDEENPVGEGPASVLSDCSSACFNTYFGADCQTVECICSSPIKLSKSATCISSSCPAMDQQTFLSGVGQYCGAAAESSLALVGSGSSTQTTLSSATLSSTTTSSSVSTTSTAASSSSTSSSSIISSSTLPSTTVNSTAPPTASSIIISSSPSTRSTTSSSSIPSSSLPTTSSGSIQSSSLPSSSAAILGANNALSSSPSPSASDDVRSHVNTPLVVGVAFGILLLLGMIGFCIYQTRRMLGGRTSGAKEFMRRSGGMPDGSSALDVEEKNGTGNAGYGGFNEKMEENVAGLGATRATSQRAMPGDGQFWEQNGDRQSGAMYGRPPLPSNPFGVRFHEAPVYLEPQQWSGRGSYAGSAAGSGNGNGNGNGMATLPLPGTPMESTNEMMLGYGSHASSVASLNSTTGLLPALDTSSLPPPPLPGKERNTDTGWPSSPTSPLRPLVLPSLRPSSGSAPTSPQSPAQSPSQGQNGHSRRFSTRSGTGILGTAGRTRSRSSTTSSSSGNGGAAGVPLPQSPPPPPQSRTVGKKASTIPEEELGIAAGPEKAHENKEDGPEGPRKESFEGLSYLLPEFTH